MIQVGDGREDDLFLMVDLRDRIRQTLEALVRDLTIGSQWFTCGPTPVLMRLGFKEVLSRWVYGGTTTRGDLTGAYQDLNGLVLLYTQYDRPQTAQRIRGFISLIDDWKEMVSAAKFVA